ncbi:hypothetical protein B5F77_12155 [Parabacteroides sp. An277]|uniref:YtxH domain-containing protein n=1 Tax=Parabacteroides sp. An277 TaxID=1965619 RepID=UPI000B365F2F|nr:YtxH domain-containing protein [Parabacteroides sp. An277]OUO50741.1 hypothetical protein B5F77_12155 [Parabacteroides sp. An277]
MKSVDSKLLLGLVVGAAVGAAVGYLAATDKREDLLNELNNVVGKVKEGFNTALAKYKEGKVEAAKPVEETVVE